MRFTVKEKASGYKFCTPEEIVGSFKKLEVADQESFWLLGFDSRNREILRECLFVGGLFSCLIDLKILFKRLLVKNCISFIVLHNHPSGDPTPSEDDLGLTRRIKEAAKILDLRFMDDIIIGEEGYISFVRNNLM